MHAKFHSDIREFQRLFRKIEIVGSNPLGVRGRPAAPSPGDAAMGPEHRAATKATSLTRVQP